MFSALASFNMRSGGFVVSCPRPIHDATLYLDWLSGDEDDDTARMVFVMYAVAHAVLGVKVKWANSADKEVFTAWNGVLILGEDPQNYTGPDGMESAANRREVFTSTIPLAAQWLADLCACYQVGKLSARNISGYFKSLKSAVPDSSEVMELINWAAPMMENVADSNDYIASLSKTKFMEYHTTYSSSAALASRFLESYPESYTHIIPKEYREVVNEALANRWDLSLVYKIPDRLKAMVTIHAQIYDLDIGTYYQGEKALKNMPVVQITAFRAFFKNNLRLSKDLSKMDSSKTFEEFVANLPDAILVAPVPADMKSAAEDKAKSRKKLKLARANRTAKLKLKKSDPDAVFVPLDYDDLPFDSDDENY